MLKPVLGSVTGLAHFSTFHLDSILLFICRSFASKGSNYLELIYLIVPVHKQKRNVAELIIKQ